MTLTLIFMTPLFAVQIEIVPADGFTRGKNGGTRQFVVPESTFQQPFTIFKVGSADQATL